MHVARMRARVCASRKVDSGSKKTQKGRQGAVAKVI